MGPAVILTNRILWAGDAREISWVFISTVAFTIGVGAIGVRRLIQPKFKRPTIERDRLLDRINAPQGVRIERVSSDNHHIVIKTTDHQEYRELMRFRDAIADINVEPGICVHRSHWVALAQIEGVVVDDGREHVNLPCGSKLPVGPKYRSNLVNAGKLSA
nr:LytTR family DNA-binding domain-containing protein [Octadecabacter sp. B2R22]